MPENCITVGVLVLPFIQTPSDQGLPQNNLAPYSPALLLAVFHAGNERLVAKHRVILGFIIVDIGKRLVPFALEIDIAIL